MPEGTKQRMLRACLVCLMLSFCLVGASAQNSSPTPTPVVSPAKQALVKEFLALANSKKTIDAMLQVQAEQMEKQLPEIVWQAVGAMNEVKSLTAAEREALRLKVTSSAIKSSKRILELMAEKIDFNKLVEDISIPLYDKYFSESELQDLVNFYKSSTGRKVMDVMPSLVADSMNLTAEIIMPKVAEMITQIQQEQTDLIEKEVRATVKAGPPKVAAPSPQKRRRH